MSLRWGLGSSFACAICLSAAGAVAQDSSQFQVERFEPMPSQGLNILNIATSKTLGHGQGHIGAFAHLVDGTLTLSSNGQATDLVESQLKVELSGAIGLLGWMDIGFIAPLVVHQTGGDLAGVGQARASLASMALGDVRLVPKFKLLDPDETGGLGFAVIPLLSLPTGSDLNTDGASRFEPRAVLDWHAEGFAIALNAAYAFRDERRAQNIVIDDVFRYGVGMRVPVGVEGLSVIASYFGDIQTEDDRDPNNVFLKTDETSTSPMEATGGLQYVRDDQWVFQLGGGAGLNEDVGAPSYRVFASAAFTPLTTDRDRDGIMDADDQCPDLAEDADGFEDLDGCPDEDNDLDGIADSADGCAEQAEDFDGFQDQDGCPDADNDADGILDTEDACPIEAGLPEDKGCPTYDKDKDGILDDADKCPDDAEDVDGFQDEDGCPDTDNDGDGLVDAHDKCPVDSEDMDGFEDEDGCPDPDNDRDGVLDADDKCPLEAEVINGFEDEDGCPDKGASKVRITETKIEILEKVFFDSGKDTIKSRSFGLLNQVAQLLKANPQITKLQVEGHTDDRGKDEFNLELSQQRAEAVKTYLLAQSIVAERVVAKGFGETTPVADNKTAGGRDQNRRVEFTIIEVNGKAVSGDGPVIIKRVESGEVELPATPE